MSKLARNITPDEVATYNNAGVVLLRGVLDLSTINSLRRCIDDVVDNVDQSPSGYDITAITRAAEQEDLKALEAESDGQHDVAGILDYVKSSGKPFLFDENEQAKGSYYIDTGIASRLRDFRRISVAGPCRKSPEPCSARSRSTSTATRCSSRNRTRASGRHSTRMPPTSTLRVVSAA